MPGETTPSTADSVLESETDLRSVLRYGLAGAVSLPIVVAAVFVALPESSGLQWWRSFEHIQWLLFGGVFAVTGGILGVAWELECRISVGLGIVILVGSVAWPVVGFAEVPSVVSTLTGTAVVGLPALVLAVPLEYAARRTESRLQPTRVEAVALVGGVAHLLAVNWLTETLEHRPFLPESGELIQADLAGMGLFVVVVSGMILLGAVPVVLAWRARLVMPLVFVLSVLGWATYRTWLRSLETLPPDGPGFGLIPTPLTLYLWGGSLLLAGAVLIGGLEYLLRR